MGPVACGSEFIVSMATLGDEHQSTSNQTGVLSWPATSAAK